MTLLAWKKVRRELGFEPIVEGYVAGAHPMFVERYVFQTTERSISGQACTALLTQFAASPVKEGEHERVRGRYLPTQSVLVPRGTPTHWVYTGLVDAAVCYFLEGGSPLVQSLITLADSLSAPAPFADALVGAAALQLVDEVQRGPAANPTYMENLAAVLLERTLRVLTSPAASVASPSHAHYARVQSVLSHVRTHLTGDLSAPSLARRAGLSLTHFRRVFRETVGMPLHSYILTARLDQARTLLTMSAMPLARIAQECGFSSQSHLTASFRKVYALTPAEFRARLTASCA